MSTGPACPGCPLCETPGGTLVFQGDGFRVVRAQEPGFPAFWRLVWSSHVAELSDLDVADRHRCVDGLVCIEQVMRSQLQPTKVNIASLGNMVPHLHWHLVARFEWDTHFPGSVWSAPQRAVDPARLGELAHQSAQADHLIATALAALTANRTKH